MTQGGRRRQVFAGAGLRITCHWPAGEPKGLVATFDHHRPDRSGFPAMRPVRTALAAGHASLTVETAANDWFLNDDTPDAMARLRRFCARFPAVRAVGFSMGGYGALLFSGAMGTREVLLLAPQAVVDPSRAPWEWRWRTEREALPPDADDLRWHIAAGLKGVAAFDPRLRTDRRQARLVCALAPGVAVVALPSGGHPPVRTLSPPMGYRALLGELLAGQLSARGVRAQHRVGRHKTDLFPS